MHGLPTDAAREAVLEATGEGVDDVGPVVALGHRAYPHHLFDDDRLLASGSKEWGASGRAGVDDVNPDDEVRDAVSCAHEQPIRDDGDPVEEGDFAFREKRARGTGRADDRNAGRDERSVPATD
jgi:hypothetical protein